MSKIEFNYKDHKYTLGFTRESVKRMENSGFVLGDIGDRPMTVLPALFAGAFIAYHPNVRRSLIDEMYEHTTNRKELLHALAEMYNEPISALLDEPEEAEGNATWTAI